MNSASPPDKTRRGSFAFPKEARLKTKREFDAVFQDGVKAVNEALVVYLLKNNKGLNRLGLAVSRKNGNAVARNRIRRLIREAFRLEGPDLPRGFDVICIPRGQGFPSTSRELRPLFRKVFLQAHQKMGRGAEP